MPPVDTDPRIAIALRGDAIYGDDFTAEEIAQWFADEEHGYSSLGHLDSQTAHYAYHGLDAAYAWKYLDDPTPRALGLGSAFGSEFRPLADRIDELTIVEPERRYWRDEVAGIPTRYVAPDPSGFLPFEDDHFDLVTAFGVLHHIPNVSHVLTELVRVTRPGGLIAVREPVVSMGDWRHPRKGLTTRERGIPFPLMSELIHRHGAEVRGTHLIGFGPLLKVAAKALPSSHWSHASFVRVDALLSSLFSFNYRYHRTTLWQRFAPTLGCWVVAKPSYGQPRR